MRRFYMIFALLCVVAIALAACGRRSPTPVPPTPALAEDTPTPEPAAQGVTAESTLATTPSAAAASPTDSGPGVISVAVNAAFKPFVFLDDNDSIAGFDVDLLNAVGEKVGLQMHYVDVSFADVLDGVARGQYDAAAGGITVTPQRTQRMAFTAPYFTSLDAPAAALSAGQALVVSATNTTISGVASLTADMAVAAQQGTTGASFVTQSTPALLAAFRSADDALNAVAEGKVDAAVVDVPVVTTYEIAHPNQLKVIGAPVTIESYAFAVNPARPDLLARLDQGLAEVRNSGAYQQMIDKWFGGQ
jgi:polar amino acid transport system substrate-binding protein